MEHIKDDKKVITGWAFYDWANSAFNLVISTAVFPPFFIAMAPETFNIFGKDLVRDSVYSFTISLAYLVIALLLPFLSGIADYSGRRKSFLKLFTFTGAIGCIALFFFDSGDRAFFALMAYIVGTVGFGSSLVFYNSYLPDIASEDKHDKVSAKGYAYGYVGSVILLVIILAMVQKYDALGFESEQLPIRIGFLLVGVWWVAFAMIPFKRLPDDKKMPLDRSIIFKGFEEVKLVGKKIWKQSMKVKFLSSYFFYIAGVNIVILLASIFAKEELDFTSTDLIKLILLLQFLAAIGAYLFAFVSEKFGNKTSLVIQNVMWIVICIASYYVSDKTSFYIISVFVGLVFGGIQSLSRSTYSKMVDDSDIPMTTYFSFYQVLTFLSVVMGTLVFGLVREVTGSLRYSVLATSVFFILGLLILLMTKLDLKGDKAS
jgi:UMF1 family MFS transporter